MSNPKKTFSKIYDQYIEKIYRFVFLKVNSQEVAQDLTSEAFLKFWERLNLEPEIENPKAFLYQITRNLITDHYREKAKLSLVPLQNIQIEDPKANPGEKVFLDSDIQELNLALAKIPENYQDVLIWYYLDELSIREISKIIDKSENAVRIMIHRALKSLRENLSDLSEQNCKLGEEK